MNENRTKEVVAQLFDKLGKGTDAKTIAESFDDHVDWYIAGDIERVPWIGKKIGRTGAAQFYQQIRELIESIHFDIVKTLVDGDRAVVLGSLESKVKSTGKIIKSEFAFDLTVTDGKISRFRMFEDSYAVAQAVS